jgi:CRP/FNR family cyclic AMP-dependent transcriptional regulator
VFANDSQVEALVAIFHLGTKLTYKKGEYIIRPGESPNGVFYIESGLVKAFNISKYGEENLLIIRSDGEIFPLIWAITGQEREIIYQTLGPTVVYRVERDQYVDYLHEHPDSLPPLLDMVVEMYRRHSERILNLEYRTVRERLISFIFYMSSRFGVEKKDGLLINAPLRHQDIASSINSSRETTSRELAYLERKGLINSNASYITIKNQAGLRAFL